MQKKIVENILMFSLPNSRKLANFHLSFVATFIISIMNFGTIHGLATLQCANVGIEVQINIFDQGTFLKQIAIFEL